MNNLKISDLYNFDATFRSVIRHHTNINEPYVEYDIEYFTWNWRHIFTIKTCVQQNKYLKPVMKVIEVINICKDVEIWYHGYIHRLFSFIFAPMATLFYTKGNRVTKLTE